MRIWNLDIAAAVRVYCGGAFQRTTLRAGQFKTGVSSAAARAGVATLPLLEKRSPVEGRVLIYLPKL